MLTSQSRTSAEAWVIPADRPETPPRLVRARADDVEYTLDDWGDRFVIVTNLDAPDFRVVTADHDRPDDWIELLLIAPAAASPASSRSPGHLAVHEWSDAQPRIQVVHRDGTEHQLDISDQPHDVEFGPNAIWATTTLRISTQSLTEPASVWDVDVETGERVLRKRTPTPGVDLDRYTSERIWATAPGRSPGAGRRGPSRRHARRRQCARRGVRLRVLRGVVPAVVLGGPFVVARPWLGVGARAPARWRRVRSPVVPRRQVAGQAQHVHRHDRGHRGVDQLRAGRWVAGGAPRWQRRRAAGRRLSQPAT